VKRALVLAATLAWLAGCATAPATPPAAHQPPPGASAPSGGAAQAGTRVGSTASGGAISVNPPSAPAVVDSTPSPDALAVLNTIPDPLGRPTAPESAAVPVPAPTEPLGDRSRAATIPDSPASPPATAPAAGPAAAAVAPATAPDSCWRVQVAAPPERERAEGMARAAQSQLGVPFVVEHEGGLYKVRTRDCLAAARATAMRDRAVAVGFDGSFRFLRPRS